MIPKRILDSLNTRCKHYAVVTHGGKVISTGFNEDNCFSHQGSDYRCHAECNALRRLPKKYHIKGTKG